MDRQQRRSLVTPLVVAMAVVNLLWVLVASPRYSSEVPGAIIGAVAVYGQGLLFALGLALAKRGWRAAGSRPAVRLSWRTFATLAVGQPLLVFATGVAMIYTNAASHPPASERLIALACLVAGVLVAACLRWDTGAWAWPAAAAMVLVSGSWAVLPLAVSRGWSPALLHIGVLGAGSDRVLHPLVTAAWQLPMAALVGVWLRQVSQASPRPEVG